MLIYNLLLKEVSLTMVVLSNSNHYENVLLPEMTVLKFLTYYAHVKDLCLKSDCSIRVYSLVFNMMTILLEYIKSIIGYSFSKDVTNGKDWARWRILLH